MFFRKLISTVILASCALLVWADAPGVSISNAWVRSTVPGQEVAGAYMEITSAKDARLIKVETPVARMAEIHSMKMENGVMRMQALEALTLPARTTVKLVPGGYHLMLVGIRQPLKAGSSVPLALTVREADGRTSVIDVNTPVR